jgi:predicted RNase H-like HicB family nuclease
MKSAFNVDFEREADGRWIAGIEFLPGVLVYGSMLEEAQSQVEALAREVVQEQASEVVQKLCVEGYGPYRLRKNSKF